MKLLLPLIAENKEIHGLLTHGDALLNYETDRLISEALVFLLVGTKSHWKCPIGYFLVDKINAKDQASLVIQCLEKASNAGLKVWSVTADGTAVILCTFETGKCFFKVS